jgi:hypothetical protein
MRSEKAFLEEIVNEIEDAERRAHLTPGCSVQGSIYYTALRAIRGSARMRLKVLDSRDGEGERESTAQSAESSGSQGAS